MQSWRGGYSTGLENRHSERALHAGGMCSAPTEPGGETSGFESQALRYAPLAQLVEHLTFNQRVGSSNLLRGIVMHT